jgi:hypothetical protein
MADGSIIAAFLNTGPTDTIFHLPLARLGLQAAVVWDLWAHRDAGTVDSVFVVEVAAHDTAMARLSSLRTK